VFIAKIPSKNPRTNCKLLDKKSNSHSSACDVLATLPSDAPDTMLDKELTRDNPVPPLPPPAAGSLELGDNLLCCDESE